MPVTVHRTRVSKPYEPKSKPQPVAARPGVRGFETSKGLFKAAEADVVLLQPGDSIKVGAWR